AGFVTDIQVAQRTNIALEDVRDWIETLEGEGYVEVARTTAGLSASITAKGRLQLGLYKTTPTTQAEAGPGSPDQAPPPVTSAGVVGPVTSPTPVTSTPSPPLSPSSGPTITPPLPGDVDEFQVVLLIHGIRTQADWGPMVRSKLAVPGQIEVI